jgi:ubiquinone biosynthesis UbiH/UbiF/VisC/COQ6 family hydroxylase
VSSTGYDVLVVGGGVAGLACAALLRERARARRAPVRIGVIEARPPRVPPADEGPGLRVLAIAPAAEALFRECGAWDGIPPAMAAPYERMRVWQAAGTPFGPCSLGFDAAESGTPNLGHIVDHDWLRLSLWNRVADAATGPLDLITGAVPAGLDPGRDAVTVRLADGAALTTRLLVGADGAESWVRDSLGVQTSGHAYGQLAIVGHVASERPHARTAWQCFTPAGPVALLPLADGRSSIVWSCLEDAARELVALPAGEFNARLTAATGQVLGALELTTPRLTVPLAVRHTHRYTGERFALIGDAAHQIHPLAGQGINLGLQDVDALVGALATHLLGTPLADPGDMQVLRRYERERKGANLLTMAAMEGLHRVFTSESSALTQLAAAGLGVVDRLPVVKRVLMARAAGHAEASRGRREGP